MASTSTSTSTSAPTPPILAHGSCLSILYIIINGALSFKSIESALGFYGVYHRHPINQLIHFFGVPLIIFSLTTVFAHIKLPVALPIQLPGIEKHDMNYATVLTLIYIVFYLSLDTFGGGLYAPFAYGMYATAVKLTLDDRKKAATLDKGANPNAKIDRANGGVSWTGTGKTLKFAAFLHFIGWYVQIHPGHAILEGAKPAILDSLGGALTSAPLFAYYEGLWALGLNQELKHKTKLLVDEYSIELCRNGSNMRACADYDLN